MDYVDQVNQLIPLAIDHADFRTTSLPRATDFQRQELFEAWNREYHAAMDRLCKNAGLRTMTYQTGDTNDAKTEAARIIAFRGPNLPTQVPSL